MRSKEYIRAELEQERARLQKYLDKEMELLDSKAVQMYTIGSRSLQRYQVSLKQVQDQIEACKKRIRELENELNGSRPRRAVGVVLRDW